MRHRPLRVIVVGGGIAGLAAAHRLTELAADEPGRLSLALFEAAGRPGGLIATERTGGFLLEIGPDSFVAEKPWALELCRRLGLGDRLIPMGAAARRLYVWHRDRLHPLPAGFFLFAPTRLLPFVGSRLFSWRGKLRAVAEVFLPRGDLTRDESVAAFVRRRFGDEVLQRVAEPLVGGIYAADLEDLSMDATLPRLREAERRSRSLLLSFWGRPPEARSAFLSLRCGMEEMVEALVRRLPEGTLRLGDPVRRILRTPEGGWKVETGRGSQPADGVIVALPAPSAAEALAEAIPRAATLLAEIAYSSTAVINLGYRRQDIAHPLDGAGFVASGSEAGELTACSFSSSKFPGRCPAGFALLRGFLRATDGRSEEATVASRVAAALRRILGIRAEPLFARVHWHPQSLPRYAVGHLERARRIEMELASAPGLALAGSALYGVGIADSVRSGEEAAARVWRALISRGLPSRC